MSRLTFCPPAGPAATQEIIRMVADQYGLSADDFKSRNQRRYLALARHEAMTLIRDRRGLSLTQIGRIFDRDHSTVHFAIQSHRARLAWGEILVWAGQVEQPDLFARAA